MINELVRIAKLHSAEATPNPVESKESDKDATALTQEQQDMIAQFSVETNLRPEWARECLRNFSFDYEVAKQQFEGRKHIEVPTDYFIEAHRRNY